MVCSPFKTFHDWSSNRRNPDWFLSLKKIYLVRKAQ
uniref:Spider venom protein NPTX_B111 n=1 Tax=Nephila pilipes TaxID=299642 RepID=A0A1X9PYH2_NEPPI|nr:spider venom protein NPTX_B111 [Nephila pilipes]